MKKLPLTPTQEQVLEFIRLYLEKYRRSPTWKEICLGFGWSSTNSACIHVTALRKKGYLRVPRAAWTDTGRTWRAMEIIP